eukprot:PLAT5829.1.p2 GENE.PLAT5829.1~~PLAT5829.1.p2  ORF type:complete len:312 (+),score=180.09 PLAT5829.1:29-964(+)
MAHDTHEHGSAADDGFLEEVRGAWSGSARTVAKDLPRLAKRMDVLLPRRPRSLPRLVRALDAAGAREALTAEEKAALLDSLLGGELTAATDVLLRLRGEEVVDSEAGDGSEAAVPFGAEEGKAVEKRGDETVAAALLRVLPSIAMHFEDGDAAAVLRSRLEEVAAGGPVGDWELVLTDVLEETVGGSCATVRLLKACTQRLIFPAMFRLKKRLTEKLGWTKDIRDARGWQLHVHLTDEDAPRVVHVRRETSIEPDETDRFELEWQLQLTFNADVSQLTAVFLRVLAVDCAEGMSEERAAAINATLIPGLIV